MKNAVESRGRGIAELLFPIEGGQILRDEVSAVAGEILEIARAEIVDHAQVRVWELLLQFEHKIGADETGAAGDEEV